MNSDSNSSSSIELDNSPVVDMTRELRTKSENDCSISGRTIDEPVL